MTTQTVSGVDRDALADAILRDTVRNGWSAGRLADVVIAYIAARNECACDREPRTWALPEEPEVGTRLVECSDHVFERQDDGWHAWLPAPRRWSVLPFAWSELFTDGPLREATRDDLAAAGIEDPVRCGGCRDLGPHIDGCDGGDER